jgi:hypothetical protein
MAIAIDANGKIYVTGSSEGVGTGWKYLTIAKKAFIPAKILKYLIAC